MPNPTPISRSVQAAAESVVFDTTAQGSTPISFAPYSLLAFTTPSTASGTIVWLGSHQINGTYTPIVLSDGTTAQTTGIGPNATYIAPAELFALPYLKGVATASAFTATVMCKG